MAGSTMRKSGLIIPKEWEIEFSQNHPIKFRIEEGKRIFNLLASGLAKAKEKKQEGSLVITEGKGGSTERRSG